MKTYPKTRAVIVGSGPSAASFDFSRLTAHDLVIGVNGTADWCPRLDWWFTLDPSPENLVRIQTPRPGVLYHAALPNHINLPTHVIRYKRVAQAGKSARAPEPHPAHTPEWWMWRWSATPGLSEDRHAIHTGGSVWGALQLAYHHRIKTIVLVGVDGTDADRVEGGRPHNLSHLPLLFASALPQLKAARVKVANANPDSRITCFPRLNFKEAVAV